MKSVDVNAFRYPPLATEYGSSTSVAVVEGSSPRGGAGLAGRSTPPWSKPSGEQERESSEVAERRRAISAVAAAAAAAAGGEVDRTLLRRRILSNEWESSSNIGRVGNLSGFADSDTIEKLTRPGRGRASGEPNVDRTVHLQSNNNYNSNNSVGQRQNSTTAGPTAASTMNGTGGHQQHRMGMQGRYRPAVGPGPGSGGPGGPHGRSAPSSHNRGGWHPHSGPQHPQHPHPGVQINQQQYKEYPYRQQGPSPRFHNGYSSMLSFTLRGGYKKLPNIQEKLP